MTAERWKKLDRLILKLALLACFLVASFGIATDVGAQNLATTLFPSAARTSTSLQSADQTNNYGSAIHCVLDTTAYTSGNITMTIQGKDKASGKYYTLLTGGSVSSISTNVYKVGPGFPVTANVSANDMLPTAWRVSIAGAATPISTYSVGCSVVVN